MTASKIFFYFCLFLILGIVIGFLLIISLPIILAFLILSIMLISLFWKNKKYVFLGFCIIFILLGIYRINLLEKRIINNYFLKNNYYGKDVVLEGIISKEPDVREKSVKITVSQIKITDNEKKVSIKGKILLTLNRRTEFLYNDKIKVSGEIETPPEFEDFNYKNYLLKDGIYAVMSFPKAEIIERNSDRNIFSFLYLKILSFKRAARNSIQRNFSMPQSSILEGMILGDNSALGEELKDKLNLTGLRHIISISGSHIVIISSILMSLLLAAGFWRGQAFYISVIFIAFFIIMAGLPSSGLRAGIMGGIFLLAQKTGRKNASSRAIVIACATMLYFNPLLLFFDVGFQLSFLASMAIIFVSPLIKNSIILKPLSKLKDFKEAIAITLACQIFTLPILAYNFSNISLASLFSNILVLPAVYLLMIFGFLSVLAGVVSNFLGWIISLPTWFLLEYFIKIIDLFSGKWAAMKISGFSWVFIPVFYLVFAIAIKYLNKKQRLKFLNY